MKVVIIKYNAGNIRSVMFALERIGVRATVTDDHNEIRHADRVIFPGVGEASSAMNYLKEKGLDKLICSLTQPVLGICLGMQLMCSHSEENDTPCLGIFDEKVKRFPDTVGYKIPQIGWNNIFGLKTNLFSGVSENAYMYFVHGYYVESCENAIAKTDYIAVYSSALHKIIFMPCSFILKNRAKPDKKFLKTL